MTDTSQRSEDATRYRIARSDAPIGTITAKTEEVFSLPEGSVVLVKPVLKCGEDALQRAKLSLIWPNAKFDWSVERWRPSPGGRLRKPLSGRPRQPS